MRYINSARRLGKKEGLQEGRQKGLQEGRQKGLQEGRQKGLQEGLQSGIRQSIRHLLLKGISPEETARLLDADKKTALEVAKEIRSESELKAA